MKPSTSVSIFTLFCTLITQASVLPADGEREKQNWPLDNVGGHYRIERWLTGTKGFSLLQKSRLDIEKKKATSHYYVSAHYKQNAFSHKSAIGRTVIAALSLFQRERWRQKNMQTQCLPKAPIISMHADFYLSVYNNNSKRSMADPSSLISDHSSGFTVNTTWWVKRSHVSANNLIEEQ